MNLNFQCGRSANGQPLVMIGIQCPADAIQLMRILKQSFPSEWARVHVELIIPNGAGRDSAASGNHHEGK